VNLSTRQVRYVCEVARQGSIRAATHTLHISQSSILAAIAVAEDALGARIFDRRPARGVQITPAGERFVMAARALLSAHHDFEQEIGGLASGTPKVIKIACFEPFGSLFIAEILRKVVDSLGPMEIVLFEGNQSQLHEWLSTGAVDLALTYDVGQSFDHEGLTRICRVPAHAILSINDPLAAQESVTISDLASRPMVLLDLPQTATYLMTIFDVLASRPRISLRTHSYETVRSAVSAGFGFSILNMRPSKHSTADSLGLVRKPLADAFSALTLVVADVYGNNKPAFVRAIISIVERFFRDLGPAGFAVTTPERMGGLFDV